MLRRMIRDGAPPGWSPLMRLVAGEIADDARDPGDEASLPEGRWPWSAIPIQGEWRHGVWREGLTERCGMSARAVSRTLADLAEVGYEMRSPITDRNGEPVTDRRGRLVYAAKGHALRFQVPPLIPRGTPQRSPDLATNEAGKLWITPAAGPADDDQSSPLPATNDLQSSPLLVSKVAESGEPIPSVSPQLKPSPQTVVSPSATSVEGRQPGSQADDLNDFEAHRRRTIDAFTAWMRENSEPA